MNKNFMRRLEDTESRLGARASRPLLGLDSLQGDGAGGTPALPVVEGMNLRSFKKLLLPPAGPLILAAAGAALLFTRFARPGHFLLIAGLAAAFVLATPACGLALLRLLDRHPPLDPALAPPDAAIVILDAGRSSGAREWARDGFAAPKAQTLERLRYGAHLHRATGLPILVSGDGAGALMALSLERDFGVPVRFVEPSSRHTQENADLSAAILREAGISRILLVTHNWHMPRAAAAFRRRGLEGPAGADGLRRPPARRTRVFRPFAEPGRGHRFLLGAPRAARPRLLSPALPGKVISMTHSRYARFSILVVAVNLLVIAWGAYVRATGSGAGCGNNWPLCHGQVVPRGAGLQTMIEYSHRASSGLALLLVAALAFLAFRLYPRGHRVRRSAAATLGIMLLEAALGAGLVLFELVADNATMARAMFMATHLGNTFLLLAAMTLTAYWANGGGSVDFGLRRPRQPLHLLAWAALAATTLVAMSGSVAALGDTLFPAESLAAGFRQDLPPAPTS